MAGDYAGQERLVLFDRNQAPPATTGSLGGRVLHAYGDTVRVVQPAEGARAGPPAVAFSPAQLSPVEAIGAAAFELRNSPAYLAAKRARPRQGARWNLPPGGCTAVRPAARELKAFPAPSFMEGSIAVGLVIVSGPTPDLQFTEAERTKVVAEVQEGLTLFTTHYPPAAISFVYDVQFPNISVTPDPNSDLESRWRDPAMAALGYPASWEGAAAYVEALRSRLHTRWAYCGFFTKYPVFWFAYTWIDGRWLVMQYANDGWGPDNIDRVFAHETGHVFGCPDEYASSGCTCGGSWGRWGKPNSNCENCAPGGGFACLMGGNAWGLCGVTPAHLGWMPFQLFAKHSGKALEVAGASQEDGAPVNQSSSTSSDNQRFVLESLWGEYFRLVAQHSGKVVEVAGEAGATTVSGALIQQGSWRDSYAQWFKLEPLGDGTVRVVNELSSKVLDVSDNSTNDGARVILWDWHGGDNQRWRIAAPITAKHSGKVLSVSDASVADGARLQQSAYHGGGSQLFFLEPVGAYFRILVQHSGKVLDVSDVSTANGAPVVQWPWNGGDNQLFRVEALADGYVRIVAKHSGKVLDVSDNSTNDGASLIQWEWNGGDNQRFLAPQSWFVTGVHAPLVATAEPAEVAPARTPPEPVHA